MRVAIVGAGLSGLTCALELERSGLEVSIFEARDRIGGRTWTVDDWQYEAGGEWIDSDHSRMIGLISRFGLELEPAPGERGAVWQEEYRPVSNLWREAKAAEELFEELAGSWSGLTLADLIEAAAEGNGLGRWWLTANLRSDEGTDPEEIGLAEWQDFYRQYQEREGGEVSALRVKGGIGQLLAAMAAELKQPARLSSPISAMAIRDGQVTLNTGEIFDAVVLTVPPPCVRRIQFTPELPSLQWQAYGQVGMAPIVKVCTRTAQVTEGNTLWDTPIQQTWNGTRGSTPVQTAYICGREAILASDQFEKSDDRRIHDWINDPWTGGGFSYTPPGFLEYKPLLRQPADRVFFAGEHTADWMGFMEGAIESGERAAAEVLSRLSS